MKAAATVEQDSSYVCTVSAALASAYAARERLELHIYELECRKVALAKHMERTLGPDLGLRAQPLKSNTSAVEDLHAHSHSLSRRWIRTLRAISQVNEDIRSCTALLRGIDRSKQERPYETRDVPRQP